jgi:uncharacterized membrane protein YjjB (DUF3815 family)
MFRRTLAALLGALAIGLVLGGALYGLIRYWLLPLMTSRGVALGSGLSVGLEVLVAVLPTGMAGYLVARWAPNFPYLHAAFLGAFVVGMGALAWPRTLAVAAIAGLPSWYAYLLILLRFGSALGGAFVSTGLQKQPKERVGA